MATGMTTNGVEFYVDDDFDRNLLMLKWTAKYQKCNGKLAAIQTGLKDSNGKWRTFYLHRTIMKQSRGSGLLVDHRDGHPENCRKDNLRICSGVENNHNQSKSRNNTSGYKGVSYCKSRGKYEAQICVDNKTIWLGRYDTAEQAHEAYCSAAIKYHGEYANFG